MLNQPDQKRTKNFKDIKKSIISTKNQLAENLPPVNHQEDSHQPTLSFKKITTNRQPDGSSFTSPSKLLTIDTHPIENIDLSSQKKKQLFLKYKPSNYQKEVKDVGKTKPGLSRNDSTNSNKSEGSHKKVLYSQFSQLAEASSKQRKKIGVNLCFNNLERKPSEKGQIAKVGKVVGANISKDSAVKKGKDIKDIKPIQPKVETLTPKLRKQSSDTVVIEFKKERKSTLVSGKSAQKLPNPPTIRELSKQAKKETSSYSPSPSPSLSPSPQPAVGLKIVSNIQTQEFVVERKESVQTITDEVRVSVETNSINISLDMSPSL